ncbi:MAG: 50S ribosomal protein L3 [Stygiobacter sp.]|jgi:large subunit ribosomal protein L3|uniref:Large ribosomal subunit protein uL3 n=1 Tax=Stygiobacter electus TaxID=3032292 RepID=A0AAE3NVU6_9BACT|nr:50S ribosomal protein L3 [Stygiobacter electus]MDF1611001.1 50S ribosomal protein L3 [Stygiobacter electus]
MPGLLAKKLGMTNIFTEDGQIVPVTILEAGPCKVYAVKTKEKDGYESLQLGFGERKEKNVNKPQKSYFEKIGLKAPKLLKEFRNFDISLYKVGDEINTSLFTVGEKVKVSGRNKGKGFQGVVRRHGFGGVGSSTHGQSDRERAPGSIGASSYPSRVFPGQRMAGRMGFENTTIRNLKIVKIIPEKNIIMVKGAVPGSINSIVAINK